ncbi:hypothetical protein BGW80DRAFT_1292365 [Lactifluus volemus]|nr:hypothetical protein BGW80DRAFT_1292365 [Lactifluus volemus]
MSKPNFQWPLDPSPQLRVVFDYLNHLSRWELDELSLLSSANFIKETLPASMGVPSRTKSEHIAFLKELQDSLYNFPLEVCFNSMVAVSPRSISRLASPFYALHALLRREIREMTAWRLHRCS